MPSKKRKKSKGFIVIKLLMSGKVLALMVSAIAVLTGLGLQTAHHSPIFQTHSVAAAAAQNTQKNPKSPTPTPKPAATPSPAPHTPAPTPAPAPPATPSPTPAPQSSPAAVAAANTQPGKAVSGLSPSPSSTTTPAPSSAPTLPPGTQSATPSQSPSSLPEATNNYTSSNWSGYFMSGHAFTSVSGSWTATNPSGNNSSTTADGTWIGIGGVNTNDLIQVGTENTISASGRVSTSAFYELIPAAPVYLNTVLVHPGDSLTATITENTPGQWTITLNDNSSKQTFSTGVAYTSTHTSAEWIQEDPSYASGGLVPFDYFGTALFDGSAATGDGTNYSISSGGAKSIALTDSGGNSLAVPSVLNSSGTGFNVYRH